jgi:hypothetical protein
VSDAGPPIHGRVGRAGRGRVYSPGDVQTRTELVSDGLLLLAEGQIEAALVTFALHEAGALGPHGTVPPGVSPLRLDAIVRRTVTPSGG